MRIKSILRFYGFGAGEVRGGVNRYTYMYQVLRVSAKAGHISAVCPQEVFCSNLALAPDEDKRTRGENTGMLATNCNLRVACI